MARFAQPKRKNPDIPVYADAIDTSPNSDIINGYVHMIKTGIPKTVTRARYFPSTMLVTDTGEVKSSWSVFCFLSSASTRMVNMGTPIINTKVRALKVYSNLGYAAAS